MIIQYTPTPHATSLPGRLAAAGRAFPGSAFLPWAICSAVLVGTLQLTMFSHQTAIVTIVTVTIAATAANQYVGPRGLQLDYAGPALKQDKVMAL